MARAFLMVLDSFGIGGAPDADRFGDAGADTLGHISAACAAGGGDRAGLRGGPLALPHLDRLGLGAAAALATGTVPAGLAGAAGEGLWGCAAEVSEGKDTPSGHWEIAGVPVPFDWGYFPEAIPCFPQELVAAFVRETGLPGILGNRHASGTDILAELGEEHIRTGKPICYTSADSVFQVAAHETHFGLDRLYRICLTARELVDRYNIGRVIARPFIGESATEFARTGNRRDYSVPPPEPTLLDRAAAAGRQVLAVGKIADIFAHQGVTRTIKATGNKALFDATLMAIDDAGDGDLVFTNFIDFDSLYGHRRDVPGYAAALDHGCDPTWRGTDHTREMVPVLAFGPDVPARRIGRRPTFADIGETVAAHLGLPAGGHGTSFL
jgi:phosphopentomutase